MSAEPEKPQAGPELADVARYAALADIAQNMETESARFKECERMHGRGANRGAAAVAERASLRLRQYAAEVRQCLHNAEVSDPTKEGSLH